VHKSNLLGCAVTRCVLTPLLALLAAIERKTQRWVEIAELQAEILFLRKQLAMLVEKDARPRRARPCDRLWLVLLARCCAWRDALVIVKPATLVAWHRAGFRLLWRWKCGHGGRPPLSRDVRELVRRMARENPTWGAARITHELLTKLGITVAVKTVRRYLPTTPRRGGRGDQRWATFVRDHARVIVACDFFVAVTAKMQVLYVFVAMELGSRRILHFNLTDHPTAAWTTQQLRETFPWTTAPYRYLLHDRDSIFSKELDLAVKSFGLRVLKSPVRAPKANARCERLIGTIRRECLNWMIPMSRRGLYVILREWVEHYNRGRPHSSLGPGFPEPTEGLPVAPQPQRHQLPADAKVVTKPILGGLHHEYHLERAA
jgi:putative transposase